VHLARRRRLRKSGGEEARSRKRAAQHSKM
jgi:hypothetical protein